MVGKIQTFKLIIDRKGLMKKLIFDVLWSVMRHFPMSTWIIGINDHLNEAHVIQLPNKVIHLTTKKVRSGNFNLFKSGRPVKKSYFFCMLYHGTARFLFVRSFCLFVVLQFCSLWEALSFLVTWCVKKNLGFCNWLFPGIGGEGSPGSD